MVIKLLTGIFLLLLSLPYAQATAQDVAKTELSFGVVPQQSASKLARLWSPILRRLSAETGLRIMFKTAPNIPEFEKRLARGEYDLAYMNPYHYTVFSRSPGYVAFARQKDKMIRGIIVVHKDSSVDTLAALAGQTLAFPAPAAFAASMLPRGYLNVSNIPFDTRYVMSHDSVYRSVAKGMYAGGGGIERTFNNVDPEIRDQLRILWRTEPYTPHAFAAHPRISVQTRKQIAAALLQMNGNPADRELLSDINFRGFVSATDNDWDDVRALRLDQIAEVAAAE